MAPRLYKQLEDREWLRSRYEDQAMTIYTIAAEIGSSTTPVRTALLRHNIPLRPRGSFTALGHSTEGKGRHHNGGSSTYRSWTAMRYRCTMPNSSGWTEYGGKGIKVCDRWLGPLGFANFLADMGERPQGTSIDRIDAWGHYEPMNCKWSTPKEQRQNQKVHQTLETAVQWISAAIDGEINPLPPILVLLVCQARLGNKLKTNEIILVRPDPADGKQ